MFSQHCTNVGSAAAGGAISPAASCSTGVAAGCGLTAGVGLCVSAGEVVGVELEPAVADDEEAAVGSSVRSSPV